MIENYGINDIETLSFVEGVRKRIARIGFPLWWIKRLRKSRNCLGTAEYRRRLWTR